MLDDDALIQPIILGKGTEDVLSIVPVGGKNGFYGIITITDDPVIGLYDTTSLPKIEGNTEIAIGQGMLLRYQSISLINSDSRLPVINTINDQQI